MSIQSSCPQVPCLSSQHQLCFPSFLRFRGSKIEIETQKKTIINYLQYIVPAPIHQNSKGVSLVSSKNGWVMLNQHTLLHLTPSLSLFSSSLVSLRGADPRLVQPQHLTQRVLWEAPLKLPHGTPLIALVSMVAMTMDDYGKKIHTSNLRMVRKTQIKAEDWSDWRPLNLYFSRPPSRCRHLWSHWCWRLGHRDWNLGCSGESKTTIVQKYYINGLTIQKLQNANGIRMLPTWQHQRNLRSHVSAAMVRWSQWWKWKAANFEHPQVAT